MVGSFNITSTIELELKLRECIYTAKYVTKYHSTEKIMDYEVELNYINWVSFLILTINHHLVGIFNLYEATKTIWPKRFF